MSKFSLRARWVLPVDGSPLKNGVVSIDQGRIVAVEQSPKVTKDIQDIGDVILLPGLVNAHTHLEFSDLARPLGGPAMPLPDWIRQVIGNRKRGDRDAATAVQKGISESLRAGVTTIGEISTAGSSASKKFQGAHLVAFDEVIGFSSGRTTSILIDVAHRVELMEAQGVRCSRGISPHAPYTVHPELLKRLVDLACDKGLPVAMHLAESREELELLATGTGPFQQLLLDRSMWDPEAIPHGSMPLDYLRMLSEAPRALVIHGNYLSDVEIQFLAEHRAHMSVIFCPRTHAYFGHDPYPLQRMLDAGVRVAAGTDSRASNPDLNLLSELRWIAEQFPVISPASIIQLGTLNGAEALGLAQETGSLTPGKWADIIALPCPADADPYEVLLRTNANPQTVWIRGENCELAH
ncbi:amidohydrolase family protein [Bythopirellula polymerisocia]|uniref:Aminodeoxyfutalosine deaminase n=1 Tax=Bythopirellula polymerisocia TaxID=2528003 RepID=A0A5C6CRU0_9BACT|nr:amidohydrolase family protein [Bythopirellula polymerisocia]TWU27270.1 Aminodeoxyfutalosine deaminase [Bythopirellula polymerisocia]